MLHVNLFPELKTAIQQLGKRHPEAYAYFVHHLQPRAHSQPRPTAMRHKASPTEGPTEQKTGDTMELLSTEDPLWKKVEGKSPNEETYWANIERTTGWYQSELFGQKCYTLTHCGLVMLFGDIYLSQHWLR